MKSTFTLAIFTLLIWGLQAQSDAQRVYTIFQTHCATAGCHDGTTAAAGLDLEGTGPNIAAQMQDVYNNIYKQTPANATAAAKGEYLIYPGDPYRSFLYRKMDNGLSTDVSLHANEGAVEPQNGSPITDLEIETVRQWILYGAKESGQNYDFNSVEDYYTNGGIESIANIPAAPDPNEGFQIHLGPFFLEPDGEVEYMSKYETRLSETIEITKFQTEMGEFSHHFIVYNFIDYANSAPIDEEDVPVGYGLRSNFGFDDKGFVITEQYSNTLELPEGTAFEWQENLVLDLNSHYINYSSTEVLKCEVYLNVYFQESGEATQIMYSQLIPNTNIPIPNDGQEHEFNFNLPYAAGQFVNPLFQDPLVHIWGIVSHTHQYGTDFNILLNNDQIYDGGCANGMPGCPVESFDYQHLPFRFFEPFVPFGMGDNMLANATYTNNGPTSVNWGLTSDDEMMLFIIFFTLDTAGLNFGGNPSTGINNLSDQATVFFYPNPTKDYGNIAIEGVSEGSVQIDVFDIAGNKIWSDESEASYRLNKQVPTENMSKGMYIYRVSNNNIPIYSGKFAVE